MITIFTVDREYASIYTAIMKKKKDSLDIVTKGFFQKELKKELKSSEKKLNKNFDDRFTIAERVLKEEIRITIEEAEERLGEKLSQATDKILTHIDPFVKEVRDSFEERAVLANQISELRDRVDDHDEQIKQLKQR